MRQGRSRKLPHQVRFLSAGRAAPKPQLSQPQLSQPISGFRAARCFPDISQLAGETHVLHVTFCLTVTIKNVAADQGVASVWHAGFVVLQHKMAINSQPSQRLGVSKWMEAAVTETEKTQ